MASSSEENLSSESGIISNRGRHTISQHDFLRVFTLRVATDPYHVTKNPKGIINMGTSMNNLMEEELLSRLSRDDVLKFGPQFQHYYRLYGTDELRNAVANFLSRQLCPERTIDPDKIVILPGVASCLDALGHVLCDPGDVLITPTPVYARIFTDFCERGLVDVQPLNTTQETDKEGKSFTFQPKDLENRIQELITEGKKVKGVILVHPHNPLGDFYSKNFLQEILQVCARHQLHVIIDEIYALSIFKDEDKFVSTLAIHPSPDPERLHFVWGLTKDFSLAGFRVGVIHTLNTDVINCLIRTATYQCSPSIIQHATATLLNDEDWCDNFFLPTNRRKLKEAQEMAANRLKDMGVKVRDSNSALFLWIDLQEFLNERTKEGEIELFEEFFNSGVYIIPGCQLCCVNPGWFRLVFSINQEVLAHGLDKIEAVLKKRLATKSL